MVPQGATALVAGIPAVGSARFFIRPYLVWSFPKLLFIPKNKVHLVVWPVPSLPHHSNSPFGWRTGTTSWHRGIDINHGGCAYSGPDNNGCGENHKVQVVAAAGGVVLERGEYSTYGNRIIIAHDNGVQTLYGHLHDYLVVKGQTVEAGQPIAIMGNTGKSDGPHLHFDFRPLGGGNSPSIRANALESYHSTDHRYGHKNPNPLFFCTVCGNKQCIPNNGGSHNFVYNTNLDLEFFKNNYYQKWWENSSSSWN